MDIIVVFGSVTSATYQHLRLAMMREGLKPKIVRIDKDHSYEDLSDFVSLVDEKLRQSHGFGVDQASVKLSDKTFDTVLDDYFNAALPSAEDVASVKAVIFPYMERGFSYKWNWATSRLPRNFAEYTVQKAENDGSFWLSGSGFGTSLPDVEILD